MAASSEREETGHVAAGTGQWRRPQPELLVELVFRPLARGLVRILLPLGVSPPAVVLANGAAGLGAAYLVLRGELLGAALLLQLKTVLDNADGGLARASGRTSALGRYLDTEVDLLVNVALFAALGYVTGAGPLWLGAFFALTLVLSADFNEDALHRRARGEVVVTEPPASGEGPLAGLLAGVYRIVFAPQDRALQGLATRRLERLLADVPDPALRARATLAYHDRRTASVLANLGLSTQLAVLGLCLALSAPEVYPWLVLASAALLPPLQLRREAAARRALR